MNKQQRPNVPWWVSMGFQNPEQAGDTDYADMGTAFGLDASIGTDAPPPQPGAEGDVPPVTDRLNRRSVI